MRRSLRVALRGLVTASLLLAPLAGTAHAGPPEGCTGFPDIPEAYICIDDFSPENATPSAGTAGTTTFWVPEFCAFGDCHGPTPVTVPGGYVAQGEGTTATITYNGETHQVPAAVAPVMSFSFTLPVDCFGCGGEFVTAAGTFTGVVNGHSYAGAAMSFTGWVRVPAGDVCTLSGVAEGTVTISDATHSDTAELRLAMLGSVAQFRFVDGSFLGYALGARAFATPRVEPCGHPADIVLTGAGHTLPPV